MFIKFLSDRVVKAARSVYSFMIAKNPEMIRDRKHHLKSYRCPCCRVFDVTFLKKCQSLLITCKLTCEITLTDNVVLVRSLLIGWWNKMNVFNQEARLLGCGRCWWMKESLFMVRSEELQHVLSDESTKLILSVWIWHQTTLTLTLTP